MNIKKMYRFVVGTDLSRPNLLFVCRDRFIASARGSTLSGIALAHVDRTSQCFGRDKSVPTDIPTYFVYVH